MAVGHLQRIASTYPSALVQVHRQRCQSSEGCGLAFLEPHLMAVGHLQRIASTYPGALVQVHGQRCQAPTENCQHLSRCSGSSTWAEVSKQ